MKINMNGKNVEITDGMRNYLEKKLNYFSKFLKEDDVITVSVSTRKNVQKLEIFFKYDNQEVKVKLENADFYINVNKAMDVLKNKVGKLHSMKTKKSRESIKEEFMEEEFIEENSEIVKRKQFELKPMTEEEALLQIYLLGHHSYIFKNADREDKICLLYKRDDDEYGIIETE